MSGWGRPLQEVYQQQQQQGIVHNNGLQQPPPVIAAVVVAGGNVGGGAGPASAAAVAASSAQFSNQRVRANDAQLRLFFRGLDAVLQQWTALNLICRYDEQNNKDQTNAFLLRDELRSWFGDEGEIYSDELEEYFFDFFEKAHAAFVEDGSLKEVADAVSQMYRRCCHNDDELVLRFEHTLAQYQAQNTLSQCVNFRSAADDESDDDDGCDEEGDYDDGEYRDGAADGYDEYDDDAGEDDGNYYAGGGGGGDSYGGGGGDGALGQDGGGGRSQGAGRAKSGGGGGGDTWKTVKKK